MRYLFLVYMALIPLSFSLGEPLRQIQELVYQISSICIILAGFVFNRVQIKPSKVNAFLASLVGWFLYVYLRDKSGDAVINNLFLGSLVYVTTIHTLDKQDIKFMFRCILGISILTTVILTLQYMGYDFRDTTLFRTTDGIPTCSFFGLKAAMGMFYAVAIPVVLGLVGIVGLLLFIPLALSYSTGAFIAGFVATLFFLWFRKRILFWIMIIPLLIGSLLFITKLDAPTGMYKTRLPMWGLVFQDCNRRVLGHGLDTFAKPKKDGDINYFKLSDNNRTIRCKKIGDGIYLDCPPDDKDFPLIQEKINNKTFSLDFWDHPHNEYLWLLYETGYIGFGLFVLLCIQIVIRFLRSKRDNYTVALMGVLISFAVFSLTQFPFHLARVGYLFPIISGLFFISTQEE